MRYDRNKLLSIAGEPCDHARIEEMERFIGRKLPEDYATFIMETGGGYLRSANYFLVGKYVPTDPVGIGVETIYGSSILPNGAHNALDDPEQGAIAIADIWEYPSDKALLFAIASGGPHVVFMINYELEEYPQHSIICFNDEMDHRLVANSFDEFLNKLGPFPPELMD